jgi:hypothetical protein
MAQKSLLRWMKALVVVAAMTVANPAGAQHPHCVGHSELVASLAENFQEKQIAFGLVGQVAIMEVYVGAAGSWTIIMTDVHGISCIIAAGDNWESTATLTGQDASRSTGSFRPFH